VSIWIPLLWVATGICLFAGVHFLRANPAEGQARQFRAFGVTSLAVATYIGIGALLQTPMANAPWLWIERLHVAAACLVYPTAIWFIALYSYMRHWRRWVVAGAVVFGALLVIDLTGSSGLLLASITPAQPYALPWGEHIHQYTSTSAALAPLYYLATLAAFVWAFWRCIALWRTGEHMRARPLLGFLILQAIATGYAEYTTARGHPGLNWDALPFLALVLLLSRSLNLELHGYAAALDASNSSLREEIGLRSQADAELRMMAYSDTVSGLPNRHALADWLAATLAATPPRQGALIVIDPQRFAVINHALGHRTGDQVIREIGRRLSSTAGKHGLVARLSGDEFAVAVLAPASDAALPQVMDTTEALRKSLAEPFQIGANTVSVASHMGLAMFHHAHGDGDELLRQAYAALHEARKTLHIGPLAFVQSMQAQAERRLRLEFDLRTAIAGEQMQLVYQPQFDRDGTLIGAEALLRWNHPIYGAVGPQEFIGIAEDSGQMPALGGHVLHMAFAMLATLRARGPFRLSVNISPWQLFLADFMDTVHTAIRETGVDPRQLTFELTETAFIHDIPDAVAKLQALAELGIRVSIDDFGTGYASIALLKTFPVDELKIDQSFVRDMTIESPDRFVAAMITLGNAMGLQVVAEGVEREDQRAALSDMGCHVFQGYLFSRPVPPAELAERVAAAEAGRAGNTMAANVPFAPI
jgi:diguanylate cyclase (GGDEF)-like protein